MTTPVSGAAKVVEAITKAAPAAATAAPEVGAVAGAAAPIVAGAAGKMGATGWFGVAAGSAGIALTLLDAWKSSVGSQKGITASEIVNPTTVAIGGGAMLLTIGEKAATGVFMKNGMRSAGVALIIGGLAGAIAGAIKTFGNPNEKLTEAQTSTQSQAPIRFGTALPPAPANLEGVEVASADVIGQGKQLHRVPVYVDPSTATELTDVTSLGDAIGQARAATQADDQDRSHAVIQTADGVYWIMRLSGELDQVDGRNYSTGTNYDSRYDPQIGRRQMAVQAIAGVESHFVFPQDTSPTAPVQYTGDIPWVTPDLPGGSSKPSTPKPAPDPAATPTPSTTEAGS